MVSNSIATNDLLYNSQAKTLVTNCWQNGSFSVSHRDFWYNSKTMLKLCSLTCKTWCQRRIAYANCEPTLSKEVCCLKMKTCQMFLKLFFIIKKESFHPLTLFNARQCWREIKMNSFFLNNLQHALYLFCGYHNFFPFLAIFISFIPFNCYFRIIIIE